MIEGLRAGIEQQLCADKRTRVIGCRDRLVELKHKLIQDGDDLFYLHAQVLGGIFDEAVTTQVALPA